LEKVRVGIPYLFQVQEVPSATRLKEIIVHPQMKQVIPVSPGPIQNDDGVQTI